MADPNTKKLLDEIARVLRLWKVRILHNAELLLANDELVDRYK